MFAIIDIEAQCTAANSHDTSPPSSPGQTRGVLSQPAIEFASNHPLRSIEKLKEGEATYKTTVTESQLAKERVTDIAQLQEQNQPQQLQTTSHKKTQDTESLTKVKVRNHKYSHKISAMSSLS